MARRLPDSLIFDPEEVGILARKILAPIELCEDFQDHALWRRLVVTTAAELLASYRRTLIMPMTIWHLPYFDEVVGGLRRIEPDFHHVCLTAPVEIIQQRLQRRGGIPGDWAWVRAERCCAAFRSPRFARQISAEAAMPEELAATILGDISIST